MRLPSGEMPTRPLKLAMKTPFSGASIAKRVSFRGTAPRHRLMANTPVAAPTAAAAAIPLALTLVVWVSYHVEGIRTQGPIKYFASWLPAGLEEMNPIGKVAIFMIEVVSHFVRLISLSVRLFANILAGHLLLLFMGGGLAVLLGIAALGTLTFPMAFAFYVFEVGLVATLQAFIFSTLTAIYIGGAVAESH